MLQLNEFESFNRSQMFFASKVVDLPLNDVIVAAQRRRRLEIHQTGF